MSPEQWRRIKSLLSEALKLPPEQRSAFAESACPDDPTVRRELVEMLRQKETTGLTLQPVVDWHDGPKAFQPGEVILNRFRIVRLIGRGGMGEVYEAEDAQLGRIALKTIRGSEAHFPHLTDRFQREIQLARKVTDPHVCRIHELFQVDDSLFLTMEYLEGETLASRIRRDGPINEREGLEIALQLCSALDAAHHAGVIHRDFKSANIMLTKRQDGSCRAVVTDFGLACEMAQDREDPEALTAPGMLLGTPAYMAPEQLEDAEVALGTDLYALGVVLYEMLTGRLPFKNDSPVVAAVQRMKVAKQSSNILRGLPADWAHTIARCLEYEVDKRPNSAAEVAAYLKGKRNFRSLLADVRRLPRLAIAGLAFSVLALAAGISVWFNFHQGYRAPSPEVMNWYSDGVTALREGTYLKAVRALQHAVQLDAGFVLAHARLADALTELDYTDQAKDEMLRASSLAALRGLPSVDRDYVEAVRATITNDYAAALVFYRKIFGTLSTSTQPYGRVDLGRALEKDGKIQEAIDEYRAAAKQAPEYPASFLRLGVLQGRLGNSQEAEAAFYKAEGLYRASSNIEGVAEVNYQRGDLAAVQGRPKVAQVYSEQVLQATKTLGNQQLEIRSLLQLSGIQQREGETEQAEQTAQRAISLARENGIGFWATQGLVLLGNAYLVQGKFDKAEPYYLEAINLGRRNQSKRLEAFASLNLGSLRERQGRTDEVIALETMSYEYYRDHKHIPNSSKARNLMGRAFLSKAQLDRALELFEEQLRTGRAISDPDMVAHAEEDIGQTLEKKEQFPEALDTYQIAKQNGRELGPGFVAYQSTHLASVLARLGRFGEIQTHLDEMLSARDAQPELIGEIVALRGRIALEKLEFRQAWDICGKTPESTGSQNSVDELDSLVCSGVAGARLGKLSELERIMRKATVANERENDQDAQLAIAEMQFKLDHLADAESIAQKVAEDAQRLGQGESEWQACYLLARIHAAKRDPLKTSDFATKSLDILETFPHNWAKKNSASYFARPDVQAARKDLLRLSQEAHK